MRGLLLEQEASLHELSPLLCVESNSQGCPCTHPRDHVGLPPVWLHPSCLKSSDGFVLPKSSKADYVYSTPRSFRVIVLLDTFSKIPEKLVQSRLSPTVHLNGLVSVHQAGSFPGASAEDAAARLMHEIDASHHSGLCATTGFFDIKGGFDNVSHPILLDRLSSLGTPHDQWRIGMSLFTRSGNPLCSFRI